MTRQQWQDKVLLFLFAAGERAGACKGSVVWSLEQPLQLCGQQRQSFEALSFDSLIELKKSIAQWLSSTRRSFSSTTIGQASA